jgi:hypothetical protein
LTDALFIAITMSCKLKEEKNKNLFLDNLMEEDDIVGVELDLLNSNINREVCNVLNIFLIFFKKIMKKSS